VPGFGEGLAIIHVSGGRRENDSMIVFALLGIIAVLGFLCVAKSVEGIGK
jgi:hypothetical protein